MKLLRNGVPNRMSCLLLSMSLTNTEAACYRVIPDEIKPEMRQRFFTFFEEDNLQVS